MRKKKEMMTKATPIINISFDDKPKLKVLSVAHLAKRIGSLPFLTFTFIVKFIGK
jgi:hypothetical protein